jgi:hypothetical protein
MVVIDQITYLKSRVRKLIIQYDFFSSVIEVVYSMYMYVIGKQISIVIVLRTWKLFV